VRDLVDESQKHRVYIEKGIDLRVMLYNPPKIDVTIGGGSELAQLGILRVDDVQATESPFKLRNRLYLQDGTESSAD